jgi:polyisoprenoid-binding protein YceI
VAACQDGPYRLGAKLGHDLTIEVTGWRGNVVIDAANPAASSVTVEGRRRLVRGPAGTGGVKPLTDADRADIKGTIRGKILKTGRYPTITFGSEAGRRDRRVVPHRW